MGLLRSEKMKHGTLILPVDRAREYLDVLGNNIDNSTSIQFEDMNVRAMSRPYKKFIQRIDEMERILRFLADELAQIPDATIRKNNVDSFLNDAEHYKLDEVELDLKRIYKEFSQFKDNNVQLTEKRNAALEEFCVVKTASASIGADPSAQAAASQDGFEYNATRGLLEEEQSGAARLQRSAMFNNIAGVIPQAEQERFARTLFRATRGNTFTHFQQIPDALKDPKTGLDVKKSVFVIYFQDSRQVSQGTSSAMGDRINKICASFGVNTYRWPTSRAVADDRLKNLDQQVHDQDKLLQAHENFVRGEVQTLLEAQRIIGNSLIEDWRLFCIKEKSIYHTLNMFEGDMHLKCSCWYPATDEDRIKGVLVRKGSEGQSNTSAVLLTDRHETKKSPPTYFRSNEFTGIFQELVDTYGLPRHGEANPALITTVTFPFLFGVMYGDVGHGTMLFLFGLYAVMNANELKHTMAPLWKARYIVFMMGLFAIYNGFLYNDFFSVGLPIFSTRWVKPADAVEGQPIEYVPGNGFDPKNEGGGGPYPFGVDYIWCGSTNELTFLNSMKMKTSVILGVVQMVVGVLFRFSNSVYTGSITDFICECCPMMMFMLCFFGFMDVMIVYKWVTPMPGTPPNIINSLISMAMFSKDTDPMFGPVVPRVLMIMAIMAIPVMLIPKPIVVLLQHGSGRGGGHGHGGGGGGGQLADEESCQAGEEEEPFDFAEILIHQVIETIEYVLGTVSHTASYLRLWALSLAHQQLSDVFFSMTLLIGLEMPFPLNILAIYCLFTVWFLITVAILLGMDVLECFLHTLRLHWVEFQSKFYKADGYAFEPFSHKALAEKDE